MKQIQTMLMRLAKEESGQDIIEYALLAGRTNDAALVVPQFAAYLVESTIRRPK